MFDFNTSFSFYEDGKDPHSVESGLYQIQYFSNIDIVNESKLFVDIKGNYHKAYIQTRVGEYHEIELNTWIDLRKFFDSNKINIIILLFPKGDNDTVDILNPVIIARLAPNRTFYDITIRYMGHATRYWWTSDNPVKQNYSKPFQLFKNTTIFAQGITGSIESEIVSSALNGLDETFTQPIINVSATGPAETVIITVTNWGVTDTQEIEITPL